MELDENGVITGFFPEENIDELLSDEIISNQCKPTSDEKQPPDSETEVQASTPSSIQRNDTTGNSTNTKETLIAGDNQTSSCQSEPLPDPNTGAIGYIHNLSPMKKGNFFDFNIQTKQKVMRGVCFSSSKRQLLQDYQETSSPVKLKKFRIDTSANSEDLVMEKDTSIELYPDIEFQKQSMPDTINISMVNSISIGQLVTFKAKVATLGQISELKAKDLVYREALLVDPTASIKLVLWQDFTNIIHQGCTYIFKDVRLKKNPVTQEVCPPNISTKSPHEH